MDNKFYIEIGANIDQLQEALKTIDADVKVTAKEVEKVGESAGTSFKEFEKFLKASPLFDKLNKATGGLGDEVIALGKGLAQAFQAGTVGAKLLKTAIITTGVGALVVAVGLLIAYWDDIKGAVIGVSGELTRQKEVLEEKAELQQNTLDLLNASDNVLKLQGKSQIQINNLKLKELKTLLGIKTQLLDNARVSLESAIQQEETYRKLAKKLVDFAVLPVRALAVAFDNVLGTELEASVIKGANAFAEFLTPDLTSDLKQSVVDLTQEIANIENTAAGLKLDNIKEIKLGRPKLEAIDTTAFEASLVSAEQISANTATRLRDNFLSIATGLKFAFSDLGSQLGTVPVVAAKVGEAIQATTDKAAKGFDTLKASTSEFGQELSGFLSGQLPEAFTQLGEIIGESLSGADKGVKSSGERINEFFASFLKGFGQLLIKYGAAAVVKGTLDTIAATPGPQSIAAGAAAIAAGIALVAISNSFGAKAGLSGGGSSGGGSSGNTASNSSGGGVSSGASSSSVFGGTGNFSVTFEIAGTKLLGVLNNTARSEGRVGITT